MPWFSYHGGHSGQFCHHAKGQLHEVVREALRGGFTTYGLSEHAPRYRAEDLYPEESDLDPEHLRATFASYVETALALKERYADRMEILVGFETEALPPGEWFERMTELRSSAPFDYIIGSVHHVAGHYIDFSPEQTAAAAEQAGGREALQCAYFDLLAELVQRLKPEIVGHFDLIRRFDGDDISFSPRVFGHIQWALEAVRTSGAALDVNAAPARRGFGPVYPIDSILRLAHEMAIPVTLGDDSHGPDTVGQGLPACVQAIGEAGYREIHYLTRQDGTIRWATAPIDRVRPAD